MTRVFASAFRTGEVGEHRRRLAETHVERQAATQAGSGEELDPGDSLGLVGAQRPREALRLGDRRHRDLARPAHDVVRPAVALHDHAAGQPRPAETDAVPQDLGTRELGHRLASRECGRRLLHIEPVDFDPAAARLHERSGLPGQSPDVIRGELGVVEQHRPGDVAELARTDDRVRRSFREQPQRRLGLAPRERRQPHLETDRRQRGASSGHEGPGLVLAHGEVPATGRSDSIEGWNEPAESLPLCAERSPAALGAHRRVDRDVCALPGRRRHGQDPHSTGKRRIELDHQLRARRIGDRTRPLIDPPRQGRRQCGVGAERRSVHAGDHHVVEVDRGRRARWRCRQFHALDALRHDRLDRCSDDGRSSGSSVATSDGDDCSWHHRGQRVDGGTIHQCRSPMDGGFDEGPVLAPRSPQARHDRAARRQPNTLEGDAPEPHDTGTDALVDVPAADRHQPTQRVLHRYRDRLGPHAALQRHTGVKSPPDRRTPDRFQASGEGIVAIRGRPTTPGPHDNLTRRPRCLEQHGLGFAVNHRRRPELLDVGHVVVVGLRGRLRLRRRWTQPGSSRLADRRACR